ncbi:UNVERIFIED_CONTAM: hypothetical protein RMT77_004051 [Armadillidium vulgare]
MDSNEVNLGLNPHHEFGLDSYLKFCRRQRGERLRSIAASFNDAKNTRLSDETFTKEEVEDLLDQLSNEVINEVETELLHNTHCESVLLTSLFRQAQVWHLDLKVDLAQLEDHEKLASIKQYENYGPRKDHPPQKLNQISPLKGKKEGPQALLEAHIEKLNWEKAEIANHLKDLEDKVLELTREKENIELDKNASEKEAKFLKNTLSRKPGEEELLQMAGELKHMKSELSVEEEKSREEKVSLQMNLESTEKSLRQIQSQLMLAEKELEKKFSQTGAFQNMKKMLGQKNSQLKQLRLRLEKYEPLENDKIECEEED